MPVLRFLQSVSSADGWSYSAGDVAAVPPSLAALADGTRAELVNDDGPLEAATVEPAENAATRTARPRGRR